MNLGNWDIDDESLVETLELVGLAEKLSELPQGLDTVIGETGIGLSGGEAHRVALARVLLADTPLIIVDEPFSALDPKTEHELLSTMLDVCADRTLIVITHHLAEIDRFDRVILLEDGKLALDGSPAGLMRTNAHFRELVQFDRG